jgi:hypothetical protein
MKKHCQNLLRKNKAQCLKLLPYTTRENLPILGSQQSKDGQAKVWAKCFTPDDGRAWYITEGSARRDPDGKAVDYLLYGLVESEGRRLDYFWISDLAAFRSPAGLPLQRDSRWRPTSLAKIAPELFQTNHRKVED